MQAKNNLNNFHIISDEEKESNKLNTSVISNPVISAKKDQKDTARIENITNITREKNTIKAAIENMQLPQL